MCVSAFPQASDWPTCSCVDNPTSWFGVRLSSPDSLRMRLHVDDIYFKILLVSVGGVEKMHF